MNVLILTAEFEGLAKAGGLADAVAGLSKALLKNVNVKVIMPRYYSINPSTLTRIDALPFVYLKDKQYFFAIYKKIIDGVEVYFVDYEEFFGRDGTYTDKNGEGFLDNDIRFIFFSVAALETAKVIGFKPDIIHLNDWQTAAAAVKIKEDNYFKDTATVFTIHNLQHQGFFKKDRFELLNCSWQYFNPFQFEALGHLNLLKGATALCDTITTVSRKYAKEIQTPQFGFGLNEHFKALNLKLFGILNGVDYEKWNPQRDKFIAKNYSVETLDYKQLCKKDLQEEFGLSQNDAPIIGFIGRLYEQKGIGLIIDIFDRLMQEDVQFVLLGSGKKEFEEFFLSKKAQYPYKVGVHIGYSEKLAHKIEAGSDFFVMPSLFEPCGLNQIYSLKYGTLPIVRAVGGLDDTVKNFTPSDKSGWGFKFYEFSPSALLNTILWAFDVYKNPDIFTLLKKRAMQLNFGWEKVAEHYLDVYRFATVAKKLSDCCR
ncbi:glycogen synthase [Hippea jasoniae]|uniref:glycogen synthase n=1 Tax=Hippea jasoniae TaxID=944479 RepID=UPI0005533D42|nr:glycogen/starch synthase [Hippea jasoniae]